MGKFTGTPLEHQKVEILEQLTNGLTPVQIAWIAGYYAALSANSEQETDLSVETKQTIQETSHSKAITILYGSRTGNGEGLAKKAEQLAKNMGLNVQLKNMETYKSRDLKNEQNLIVIVSTHGEGEPPFAAKELHSFIFGKRAPKVDSLNFAVLALGDSSYLKYCQTGIDFDKQLEKLGANRIAERIECDVDFEADALTWLNNTLSEFNDTTSSPILATPQEANTDQGKFDKNNPDRSEILEKIQLYGEGSDRSTLHLELDTQLKYQPGDSLGILPQNSDTLIDELIATLKLDKSEKIDWKKKSLTLYDLLKHHFELSKITIDVIKRFQKIVSNEKIKQLLSNKEELEAYLYGRDIIDLFKEFSVKLSASELINLLRPIQPRLYSIASSNDAVPGEVHLTVGVVDYHYEGRDKQGACSGYLNFLDEDTTALSVFVEENKNFRLPDDPEKPIIMIGAGTGIAPFRAFLQHREVNEHKGKNWLFFGNRNFETEFLYQTEWQSYLKCGLLTKINVAFSRDSENKVYVQNRLAENAKEVYRWLQDGAHFYICGDMKRMAGDVQDTLKSIIETEGGMTTDAANEYFNQLQKDKRLQLDVY